MRARVSNTFNILNESIKEDKIKDYKLISIMDCGYQGIYTTYRFSRNSDKYIIRMYSKTLYNAVRRNKNKHNDLKKFIGEKNEFETKIVKIVLNTSEIEHLATNLSKEEATVGELAKLYNLC